MGQTGELLPRVGSRLLLHSPESWADRSPLLCVVHLSLRPVPCSVLPFAPTARLFAFAASSLLWENTTPKSLSHRDASVLPCVSSPGHVPLRLPLGLSCSVTLLEVSI